MGISVSLREIISWLPLLRSIPYSHGNRIPSDVCVMSSFEERSAVFKQIRNLDTAIKPFLAFEGNETPEFISLGQNCTIAWYLKQTALKKASYPYDWIFTSPEIVDDSITNEFVDFLDQQMLIRLKGKPFMGHRKYHSQLFNHKNPVKDAGYYERCSERFLNALKSNGKNVFLMILLNETEKRRDWKNGFDRLFTLPINQTPESVMPMIEDIQRINPNARFILIDAYTDQNSRGISSKLIDKHIFFISALLKGQSTGVFFTDSFDDFLFKLLFLTFRN